LRVIHGRDARAIFPKLTQHAKNPLIFLHRILYLRRGSKPTCPAYPLRQPQAVPQLR
jgi:hypothetical protein